MRSLTVRIHQTGGTMNTHNNFDWTAFLVELFPFHVRAKGITVFQWFSRMAGFFNQFVNPIGIDNAGWRFYISYCIWLVFEVVFVYFLFPETAHKTLEELAFREYSVPVQGVRFIDGYATARLFQFMRKRSSRSKRSGSKNT